MGMVSKPRHEPLSVEIRFNGGSWYSVIEDAHGNALMLVHSGMKHEIKEESLEALGNLLKRFRFDNVQF